MDNDLYWITAGAFLFFIMAAHVFVYIDKRDFRVSSIDYLVYIALCILWPFLLAALAGSVVGAVSRWAWNKVSK